MSEDDPLSENLKTYEQARREEYQIATKGLSDDVAEEARKKLAELLPEAQQELVGIMRVGNKDDAVRLQAVKLVFEYTLGKPSPKTTRESDIDKIMESLMPKDLQEEQEEDKHGN